MRFFSVSALAISFAFGAPAIAGAITPFSLTQDGLTVSFSSSPQTNAFTVSNAIQFVSLHGGTLMDFGSATNQLTVTFSLPVAEVAVDTARPIKGYMEMDAYDGAMYLGNNRSLTFVPAGGTWAECQLDQIAPGPFSIDHVVLYSTNNPGGVQTVFAIDNLLVTLQTGLPVLFTFDTPEPVTLALFGTGLIAAAALRRRRKAGSKA